MPKFIAKLGDDKYCEWSTVVDAPVSMIFTMEQFRRYYRRQYGEASMEELPKRLARAEETGCSALSGCTAEDLIRCNRAGPDESELTLEQIIERYSA